MAARTSNADSTNDNKGISKASPGKFDTMLLVGHAMNRTNRAPALATGALPVVRLGAEAAAAAAVHRLALQQLLGEVTQDQEVVPSLALDLVHGGVDQRHQSAYRRTLTQLAGQEIHRDPLAISLLIQARQREYRRNAVVARQNVLQETLRTDRKSVV